MGKPYRNRWIGLGVVGLWLLGMGIDRLWLAIDQSVPSWDPADNLTNSLNFWQTLQHADWFSESWWTEFWMRSSKYPPLLFSLTALFQDMFGRGADQSMLVNLLFSAILLGSVYGIGKHLLNAQVGQWAAGLCLLLPRLYTNRLQYFMDFPVTALVALSFYGLTLWRDEKNWLRQWFWALGFGGCFGLAVLTKQSALFFLAVPLLWVGIRSLWYREWERFLQLLSGAIVTLAITLPWVSTNWVFQIGAGFSANVKSADKEGDPALNTLAAWTYYWNDLPSAISLPLLVVPLVGLVLYWLRLLRHEKSDLSQERSAWAWLAVFWVSSYLIWSAIANKDHRYIMPYLPIVAIGLAYGLTRWSYRWRFVAWGTVGLAALLMILNLFPIGGNVGAVTQALAPQAQLFANPAVFPHAEIIDEIIRTQPYQIANIGMLASNPVVNQHNFNYYGNLRDFQVYSRQMGRSSKQVETEVRSLSWFITYYQQGQSRRLGDDSRSKVIRAIRHSPDYQLYKVWQLPNQSYVRLYHRLVMPVQVERLTEKAGSSDRVQLNRVIVPDRAPPGQPLAVTYEWSGMREQLQQGLVLLSWRHQQTKQDFWIHDHGIGLGTLHQAPIQSFTDSIRLKVTEQTAMLPPDRIRPGAYALEATYLNAQTGETYPIAVPPVTVTIDPSAAKTPAPELDWVTRLRSLATQMPEGRSALDRIFGEIGQLNMYDPIQAYVVQAEQTLTYRLQQEPKNRDYAYGVALSRALQQKVKPTIAALEQVVKLDPHNPNAYAYLSAVNLYALHPQAAQVALMPALAIAPDSPELQALSGLAALMRGNLWDAWQQGQMVRSAIQNGEL
jgi:4-amino-4-deoxy-L-arabinose transferase-like glycosyltransferase